MPRFRVSLYRFSASSASKLLWTSAALLRNGLSTDSSTLISCWGVERWSWPRLVSNLYIVISCQYPRAVFTRIEQQWSKGSAVFNSGKRPIYRPAGFTLRCNFREENKVTMQTKLSGLMVLCETKRNETVLCEMVLCETVLCETVLCEMVLCETVLCETVTQAPMRLNFSRWRPNPEN